MLPVILVQDEFLDTPHLYALVNYLCEALYQALTIKELQFNLYAVLGIFKIPVQLEYLAIFCRWLVSKLIGSIETDPATYYAAQGLHVKNDAIKPALKRDPACIPEPGTRFDQICISRLYIAIHQNLSILLHPVALD